MLNYHGGHLYRESGKENWTAEKSESNRNMWHSDLPLAAEVTIVDPSSEGIRMGYGLYKMVEKEGWSPNSL